MQVISFFKRLGIFLFIVILQVFIFGRVNLFGYAAPVFYLWIILHMDSHMSKATVLLWSFFLGIAVDMFTSTPGLNAAAATLTGYLQPVILNAFVRIDKHDTLVPSCSSMGWRSFMLYCMSLIFIHCMVLFLLRGAPDRNIGLLAANVAGSFLITLILVFCLDLAFSDRTGSRQSATL